MIRFWLLKHWINITIRMEDIASAAHKQAIICLRKSKEIPVKYLRIVYKQMLGFSHKRHVINNTYIA